MSSGKRPWRVDRHPNYGNWYISEEGDGGVVIADLVIGGLRKQARLISAAPELLEALEMVRDADNDCIREGLPTIPAAARAKIDAAIRKATGEAP